MDDLTTTEGVHRLVLVHGRERAREMVDPKRRVLVDIAAEVMADEGQPDRNQLHRILPDQSTAQAAAGRSDVGKEGPQGDLVGRARPLEAEGQADHLRRAVRCSRPDDPALPPNTSRADRQPRS